MMSLAEHIILGVLLIISAFAGGMVGSMVMDALFRWHSARSRR
jgi:hypothetical protein